MPKRCCLCKSSEINDIKYGNFLEKNGIKVHYFCLLLTSNLTQRGGDKDGIFGFLIVDIKEEIKRISQQKCYFCNLKGANVTCCERKCKRSFHVPCGYNKCLSHFAETFQSFCDKHFKVKHQSVHDVNEICSICYEPMGEYNPLSSIHSDCCKSGWFHKICIATFATNAGYFFRCPLCNNDSLFRKYAVKHGIFVPDQDAAWEREPNAFAELLERPDSCEAEICKCLNGRKFKNAKWQIIRCGMCGSNCVHQICSGIYTKSYKCATCIKISDNTIDSEDESIDVETLSNKNEISSDDEDENILRPERLYTLRSSAHASTDSSSSSNISTSKRILRSYKKTSVYTKNYKKPVEFDNFNDYFQNQLKSSTSTSNDSTPIVISSDSDSSLPNLNYKTKRKHSSELIFFESEKKKSKRSSSSSSLSEAKSSSDTTDTEEFVNVKTEQKEAEKKNNEDEKIKEEDEKKEHDEKELNSTNTNTNNILKTFFECKSNPPIKKRLNSRKLNESNSNYGSTSLMYKFLNITPNTSKLKENCSSSDKIRAKISFQASPKKNVKNETVFSQMQIDNYFQSHQKSYNL